MVQWNGNGDDNEDGSFLDLLKVVLILGGCVAAFVGVLLLLRQVLT